MMTSHSSGKFTAGFDRASASLDGAGLLNKTASGVTVKGLRDSNRMTQGGIGDMTDVSDREQLIYSKEKHD
jgi:hypothetical protein